MGYDWVDWNEYEGADFEEEDEEMAVTGDVNWELLDTDDRFREHASCKGMPAEVFFIAQTDNGIKKVSEAKTICNACPVIDDCLRFAMNNNIQYGIWGATTPAHRKRLRKTWFN